MVVTDENRVREISKPLFGNAYRLELLAIIGDFKGPFYARQIARQMGVADNLLTSQLGRLCELGLLEKRAASSHVLYTRQPSRVWEMAKQLRVEFGGGPDEKRDRTTDIRSHVPSDLNAVLSALSDLGEDAHEDSATDQLRAATRAVTAVYEAAMVPTGVKVTQLPILVGVGDGDLSVTTLAETLALDRTTLTRNLKVLEERGLIRVTEAAEDPHVRMVSLTLEGSRVLAGALTRWEEVQSKVEEHFGRARLRALYDELKALQNAIST